MSDDNHDKPTTDRRFPGKTVTLRPPRSYEVGASFGPLARKLGEIEHKVLAEFERGGDNDRNGGR